MPSQQRPSFLTGRGEHLLSLEVDDFNEDSFSDPEPIKKTSDLTLADIWDSGDYRGKVEVGYEYDHGDGWEHQMVFLGRADPTMRKAMNIPDELKAVCLGGEVRIAEGSCSATVADSTSGPSMCRRLRQHTGLGKLESLVQEERRCGWTEGVVQAGVREWRPQGIGPVQVGHLRRQ